MEKIMYFDALKAFGYIEGVVKSDVFFSEIFTSYVRNIIWATILYKYHGSVLSSILININTFLDYSFS